VRVHTEMENKFWECTLDSDACTTSVRFGKIGVKGTAKTKKWPTEAAARKDFVKQVIYPLLFIPSTIRRDYPLIGVTLNRWLPKRRKGIRILLDRSSAYNLARFPNH
jgi:hypothetical protein